MRYVASKKPLSVKRGEEKISVPSEYPQYDSLDEVRGLFGNDDSKLLGYFNSSIASDSAVPARVYANSADAKDKFVAQVIAKCAELRKNFNPATSGRNSVLTASAAKDFGKAIAEAFTSGNELSADQIRALIEAARNS